jgi:tetratricopeptide (TPR) repeat protein/capsular polysaccharide biosynthesis protein
MIDEKQQELAKTIVHYQQALALKPDSAEIYYNLAVVFHKVGDWEKAVENYQRALALEKNYPKAYFHLGLLYDRMGQLEEAIDNYWYALENQPDYIEAYSNLGSVLAKQKKFQDAIQVYQEALKLNPVWETLHNNLGQLYLIQGKPDLALIAFRRAITAKPEMALAHHNLGRLWLQQGDCEQAIECFLRVMILEPENTLAYSDCAQVLSIRGQLQKAMEYFREAIAIEPVFVDVYCRRAKRLTQEDLLDRAKISCSNFLKALLDCEDLRKVYDSLWHTYFYLGEVLFEYGSCQQATVYYQQALQIQPDRLELYLRLGNCLVKQQRFDAAIAIYQMGLSIEPLNPEILLQLGRVLEKQNRLSAAINYYEKILKLQQEDKIPLGVNLPLVLSVESNLPKLPQGIYRFTEDWIGKCLKEDAVRGFNYLEVLWQQPKTPRSKRRGKLETVVQPNDGSNSNQSECGGVTCGICMGKLMESFAPVQLAQGVYYTSTRESSLVEPAKTFIATVPQGKVWVAPQKSSWMICNAIAVITPDDYLLGDVSRFYPWYLPGCQNHQLQAHPIFNLEELPPLAKIDGNIALLSTLSANVYYHWTIDLLPRIDILRHSGIDLQDIDWFIVNNIDRAFQKETLKALGIPLKKVICSDKQPYIQAERLIVPSFPGHLDWVPEKTVDFLRDTFLKPKQFKNDKYPEKIYISRAKAKYRQVLNEVKVMEILSKEGFVSVSLENMSVAEQAELFARAKAIVAPHGAGLTNLVFCSPGINIIEIFSPNYVRTDYWMISQYLQLNHYYLIGKSFDCYPIKHLMYQNSLTEDILVNLNSLQLALRIAKVE